MLQNFFLSTLRNLGKSKVYSFLNILGLAIGMAGSLLILQYVVFERSYNDFHENGDSVYRISYSKEKGGVESFNTVLTYSGVGPLLKEKFPEVTEFCRLRPASTITSKAVIRQGEKFFEEEGVFYTDPSFFKIFSFELIQGDPSTALKDQFTAVISESMAKKYFGDEDPIGKTITKGRKDNHLIVGVMKDTPRNSHFTAQLLLSHSTLAAIMYEGWSEQDLGSFHGHLYILLDPLADPASLEKKFPQFVMDFIGGKELAEQDVVLKLHSMALKDIHLKSHIQHESEINGDEEIVHYMSIIAFLILAIAIVNYVNLSTSRSMQRAKEIGIRKVSGATRSGLLAHYLGESALINFFAILLGLIFVLLAQPFLGELGAPKLVGSYPFLKIWFWQAIGGIWILSTLFSGFYPALVLSSYDPVLVLKGRFSANRKGIFLRKGLVIFQFASSVAMIIAAMIIYSQINFMKVQELGMNIDDKLIVKGPVLVDSTYNSKYVALKNDLMKNPMVQGVSASQSIPGKEYNSATWFTRVDNPEVDRKFCYINVFDDDFAKDYQFEFLAGANFEKADKKAILINESTLNLFEMGDPENAVGKSLTSGDPHDPRSNKWKIKGVVKDFNQQSLKLDYSPVIMFMNPNASNFYSIRLISDAASMTDVSTMLDHVRTSWIEFFPGNPFNYQFLREGFDEQYRSEVEFGRLLLLFSGLTILVAILGLIGLSSYSIQQRTKELGIRKVLGSGVGNIIILLSKDTFFLIILANIIAWPLCWYLLSSWLEGFAFRIELGLLPFFLSFLVITLIAGGSIAFYVARASFSNPIHALKYE